jgi:RIO kinase 1
MKTPPALQSLVDDGVIDEVLRSLKSGKEATVYLVRSGIETRCAKVYRNMAQRSFQKRAKYQEGRAVRGSRQARAMGKSTSFGRKEQEAALEKRRGRMRSISSWRPACEYPGRTATSTACWSWNW